MSRVGAVPSHESLTDPRPVTAPTLDLQRRNRSSRDNSRVPTFFEALNDLVARGVPFVSVTVVDTMGSVPQDRGSKALVTAAGLQFGTVGGGKIEKKAIDEAINLLNDSTTQEKTRFFQWSLNKDVGMTCGGVVKL